MIKVRIPKDKNFNFKECKKLFKKYKKELDDKDKFRDIVNNTFFYSFFDDSRHIGCIYFYEKDGKMFVSAVAHRHTHLINLECFKMALSWFSCDIYAYSVLKTSILCLLRTGFKKVADNLYKYEREVK